LKLYYGVVLYLLVFCNNLFADSWPDPVVQSVSSPNGKFILTVKPKDNSLGENSAHASIYTFTDSEYTINKTFRLNNKVSPSTILITNEGVIYTFDNYGRLGSGYVVVIYNADGQLIKQYKLSDLYTDETKAKIKRTVSSTRWRSNISRPWTYSDVVCVRDSIGGSFMFSANTGEYEYSTTSVCELAL
jgi:hypothetical protein